MFPSIQLDSVVSAETSAIAERRGGFSFREAIERAAGFCLLACASPVLVPSAILLAALSGRSPLVAHLRTGRNNVPFWMLKLRTMWGPATDPSHKRGWIEYIVADLPGDNKSRWDRRVVSRFARFCRRHSLDELPQFWHVACGQMSIVGPRPLTRSELSHYYGSNAAELLSVKPGLTGLWQVSGRSAVKYPQRAQLDLRLVRELTPRMYLAILARTLVALLRGDGAW